MGVIVAALVAAISCVAAAVVVLVRWWLWRPVVRRRVLVQAVDGMSFDAVVMSRRGTLLVLGDVTIRGSGAPQRVDGVVVVERRRVAWLQVVG